jgi:hypothetical protein
MTMPEDLRYVLAWKREADEGARRFTDKFYVEIAIEMPETGGLRDGRQRVAASYCAKL